MLQVLKNKKKSAQASYKVVYLQMKSRSKTTALKQT